eukprot:scaffold66163_cov39-Prasinocladus_malaysianus.AAC.1
MIRRLASSSHYSFNPRNRIKSKTKLKLIISLSHPMQNPILFEHYNVAMTSALSPAADAGVPIRQTELRAAFYYYADALVDEW